jgi:hypothetical protein
MARHRFDGLVSGARIKHRLGVEKLDLMSGVLILDANHQKRQHTENRRGAKVMSLTVDQIRVEILRMANAAFFILQIAVCT